MPPTSISTQGCSPLSQLKSEIEHVKITPLSKDDVTNDSPRTRTILTIYDKCLDELLWIIESTKKASRLMSDSSNSNITFIMLIL